MGDLPDPPVPADGDLKNYPYTKVYRRRLFASAFHGQATDSEWRAGMTLWLESWDQVPAGSLPDHEGNLCRLAGFGIDRKKWANVRTMALRNWILCSDGRLYHHVVAEGVNEALATKQNQSVRGTKGASARWNKHASSMQQASPEHASSNACDMLSDGQRARDRERKKDTPLMPPQRGEASDGELFVCERSGKAAKATKPPRRRAVIPDGFEPDAAGWAYAASLGATRADFAAFTNHHRGKGSVMADWQHAWRTWCDRVPKFAGTGAPRQPAERAPVNGVMAMLLKRKAEAARRTITPDYPMLEGQPDDATH